MSELINKPDNRTTIHWKLLTGVSALAVAAYVTSANLAKAGEADNSQVWIELGGQLEGLDGLSGANIAPPFALSQPRPSYQKQSLSDIIKPPVYGLGEEGAILFEPARSDWVLSAGFRYGRANSSRQVHQQPGDHCTATNYGSTFCSTPSAYSNAAARTTESHLIVDFQAGKDFGLGLLGHGGTSIFSVGVRFAQFSSHSGLQLTSARPTEFKASANISRRLSAVGPSIAWNASAPLAGNQQDGEISLDWGVNVAALFGRQKASVKHATSQINGAHYSHHASPAGDKAVVVPNVGAFAGFSFDYPRAKVSIGYKADFFFNAIDGGIDVRKEENRSFMGPYASISIGLGG